MAENDKPDFAPKEYKMPKLDFSDTDVGKQQAFHRISGRWPV